MSLTKQACNTLNV